MKRNFRKINNVCDRFHAVEEIKKFAKECRSNVMIDFTFNKKYYDTGYGDYIDSNNIEVSFESSC